MRCESAIKIFEIPFNRTMRVQTGCRLDMLQLLEEGW